MATADLGIRVILTDTASSGFASIGLSVNGLLPKLLLLSQYWNQMSPLQQTAAGTAIGAGLAFETLKSGLTDVVNAAADLQASMIQVSINVQGADARATDMKNTLINLADYSVFSAQQVADGFVLMGQKGFTAADIIDNQMGKSMIDLAEAINTQTVPAATLLSSAMQTWHADASQGAYYANALSFAFHNGVPDVSGLQQAIMQAGAQAVNAKIPFKDFVLMLDELGKSGLSGSQAATSLRYMIASLLDPTAKAGEEMANLGVITVNNTTPALNGLLSQTNALIKNPLRLTGTLKDLNDLYTTATKVGTLHTDQSFMEWATGIGAISNKLYDANGNFQGLAAVISILGPKLSSLNTSQDFNMAIENLFNVRGGKGASALLNDLGFTTDQIKKMSAAYDQYIKQDGARQAANKTTDGNAASLKELGATMHDLAATIGTPLLGPLTTIFKHLNDFFNMMRTQHPTVLKFVGIFLLVGTAISGIIIMIVGLVAALAFIGAPLAVVGAVVGVIVGISAAITLVIMNFSKLQGVGSLFVNAWKMQISLFLGIISSMLHALSNIPGIGGMFGQAAAGVDGLIKKMQDSDKQSAKTKAVTADEANAKIKATQQSIAASEANIAQSKKEAASIQAQLAQTTNVAQREALQKRLAIINNQIQEGQQVVSHAKQQQDEELKSYASVRVQAVDSEIKKHQDVIAQNNKFIAAARYQLETTKSDSAKAYLQKRIDTLVESNKEQLGAISDAEKQRNGILMYATDSKTRTIKSQQDTTNGVLSALGNMKDAGLGIVSAFTTTIPNLINGLPGMFLNLGISLVKALAKGIGDHIGDVGNALTSGLRSIPGLGGILSGGANILSHIPGLAAGGLVTSPTLALIGEGREPEVVLPVSKLAAFMDNYKGAGGGMSGGNIVVPFIIDGQQVAGVVVDRITGQVRQMGGGRMFR